MSEADFNDFTNVSPPNPTSMSAAEGERDEPVLPAFSRIGSCT